MEIPNIVEKIEANMEAQIKRYPTHTTRASSIGYFVESLGGCLRRGVLERTSWEHKKLHDVGRQMIFNEGNIQERQVLKSIADAGFDIVEQSGSFVYKNEAGTVILDGTIDGKLVIEMEAGRPKTTLPIEIKSMSPFVFDGVFVIEDFKKKFWTKAYLAQMTVYIKVNGAKQGIFFLKNKSTGQIKQIVMDLDEELAEECLQVARDIQSFVEDGSLPEPIDNRETCRGCPLNEVCLPHIDFTKELTIADDPNMEKMIEEYLEIEESAKKAKKMWEIIGARMAASAKNGVLNMELGRYHLTGKKDAKSAFRKKIKLIGVIDD